MAKLDLIFVSGIGPGDTGVGRFVEILMRDCDDREHLIWRSSRRHVRRDLWRKRKFFKLARETLSRMLDAMRWRFALSYIASLRKSRLVLIHTQTLGSDWCLEEIRKREMTELFVVDNSFFCRKSYNHRAGAACLDCLAGHLEQADANGCKRFPVDHPGLDRFIAALPGLIDVGKIRFLAQNESQRQLILANFGSKVQVANVGLDASDWHSEVQFSGAGEVSFDVVFHGSIESAKGGAWAIELAASCPDHSFFFPFPAPSSGSPSPNCHFAPCRWDTGLGAAVARAKVVLVPSRWSAPIEGALVKSLCHGRLVAVVSEPFSYANDLPEGIALILPTEIPAASQVLRDAIHSGWMPNALKIAQWKDLVLKKSVMNAIRTAW